MIMTPGEQFIAEIILKNKICLFEGQNFEDLFTAIMTKAETDFQKVKAYGNSGDQKNDGFIPSKGIYYQVFAPEEITKQGTIQKAIKKMETDFDGLYNSWNSICKIKEYCFVINDKFRGAPPQVHKQIFKFQSDTKYVGIKFKLLLSDELVRIFNSLSDIDKTSIVGIIPSEEMPTIEFEALANTIQYLVSLNVPPLFPEKLIVPDFEKKMDYNNLNTAIKIRLINASYQIGDLDIFFNDNPGKKELIQKTMHALYEESKKEISTQECNYSDRRFQYVLQKACPQNTYMIQTCVIILMSFYFSSCDIFEEPII